MGFNLGIWGIPFVPAYAAITGLRNWLYDNNYRYSIEFTVPVVCVGNLSTGGTGKTPFVIWLVQKLKEKGFKPAVISRGYGRTTKGYLTVLQSSKALEVGDEPLLIKQKLGFDIPVVVCEQRAIGIPALLFEFPETDIVVMDDGFQHRMVKPSFTFLLTPYNLPFWKDHLLPRGNLREAADNYQRADCLLLTKVPENQKPSIPTLKITTAFSRLKYGNLFSALEGNNELPKRVVSFCGLAEPKNFQKQISALVQKENWELIQQLSLPDHYAFTEEWLKKSLLPLESKGVAFVCTEKDLVKLLQFKTNTSFDWFFTKLWVLPVEVDFEPQQEELLLNILLQKLKKLKG